MPRDAHGPGIRVVTAARTRTGRGRRTCRLRPAPAQRGNRPGGAGQHRTSRPGPESTGPATPAVVPAARGAAAPRAGKGCYPYELAAAALLAAGVLSALGRRRREQLWHRAFGRQVAVPVRPPRPRPRWRCGWVRTSRPPACSTPPCASCPSAGRAGPGAADGLRRAPRRARTWTCGSRRGRPGGARAVDGRGRWTGVAAAPRRGAGARSRPGHRGACARTPGLVSIGTDDSGRVLVDLESAQGLIAISGEPDRYGGPGGDGGGTGDQPLVRPGSASRWSGFGADLARSRPGRSPRSARSPRRCRRWSGAGRGLADPDGIGAHRPRGLTEAWAPHYLIWRYRRPPPSGSSYWRWPATARGPRAM